MKKVLLHAIVYGVLVLNFFVSVGHAHAQSILGVDVSSTNGTISWVSVKAAGKEFAFARATDGNTFTDNTFHTNMTNGSNAGVVMGAYHYAEPDSANAVSQAQYFLSMADSFIGNGFLPPVLDIESTGGLSYPALTTWAQDWMNEVQLQTGVIPIVYTSKTIASNLDSSINTYKLWMASWDGNTSPPTNLGVWTDWAFKQYSGSGTVPGISGLADLDVFNGDSTAFSNLIGVYTGISAKHADNNFIMYPNPVVNNLIIESSHAVVIEITNIEGQLIKTLATTDNKTFIDVFSFPSGVYIVKVKTEKGIEVRKFVKE